KLYDAVREYMEIGPRVQVLNEKLVIASDFLDAIHDHLNNSAMERITWIIIWLIVVACLVELGEVIARLVVHATTKTGIDVMPAITQLPRAEVLRILDGISDS
ncbi:Sad1-interacting factor 3, partial [Marasmius crinis-equi]